MLKVALIIAYLIISFIVGYAKYYECLAHDNYVSNIPAGDLEFYEFRIPSIITLSTVVFLPSLIVFAVMCLLNR